MEIEFHGEMTKEILDRTLKLLRKPPKPLIRIILLLIILALILLIVIISASLNKNFDAANLLTPSYIMVTYFLPVILMMGILYFGVRFLKSTDRTWKSNPTLRGTRSGVISEEGIQIKGEDFETVVKWSGLTHYRNSADMMLLFISRQVSHFFPREFFANEAEWESFINMVVERLPEK